MDPLTLFHKRIQQYSQHIPPSHLRKYLGKNPALTIDMVLQDMEKNPNNKSDWTFENLCYTIPLEQLVENNILPQGDFQCTQSYNLITMKLTIDTILQTHKIIHYDWAWVTVHPSLKIEDILAHPELPWDYPRIAYNPNFKFHHLPHFPKISNYIWFPLSLDVTYEQIINHPDKPWKPCILSSPHIHKHHIIKLLPYFEQKFPSRYPHNNMRNNPNLSFDDLYELVGDYAFRDTDLFINFTYQDFKKYKKTKNPRTLFLFRHILPLSVIKNLPGYETWDAWNRTIELNKTVSYESFKEIPKTIINTHTPIVNEWYIRKMLFDNSYISHYDKKRLLEELLPQSDNFYWIPNTIGVIQGCPSKIETLFESPIFLEPTFEEIKNYFAGKRIVRCIVECITNPDYDQCRKRLIREHEILL